MENPENYINHLLNTSVTKQAFSFAKTKRFLEQKKLVNESVYHLPSTKSHRACSFGYGSKVELALRRVSPPPTAYSPKWPEEVRNTTFSFAKGRQQIKANNFLRQVESKKRDPGPTTYRIKESTLSRRLKTEIEKEICKKAPGPGSYEVSCMEMKNSGSFFLSNYKNKGFLGYQRPSSVQKIRIKTVGPTDYECASEFNRSVLSKFKNSISSSFSRSERKGPELPGKKNIPGFKYKRFSQFGNK